MARTTSEGMGYRFWETNRRISTAGVSNIITRLASRTVTGHELPIHVHQHYGLDFNFILNPNTKNNGSVETCMRRRFSFPWDAQEVCLQHQQRGLGWACLVLSHVGLQHHSARVAHRLQFSHLTYSATVLPIFTAVRYMRDTPIYTTRTQIFSILWQTSVQHVFPAHRWTERGSHQYPSQTVSGFARL